jgi:predicted RNA-binding Zn-ribbon protein involved in translation (DUF1610 family)
MRIRQSVTTTIIIGRVVAGETRAELPCPDCGATILLRSSQPFRACSHFDRRRMIRWIDVRCPHCHTADADGRPHTYTVEVEEEP